MTELKSVEERKFMQIVNITTNKSSLNDTRKLKSHQINVWKTWSCFYGCVRRVVQKLRSRQQNVEIVLSFCGLFIVLFNASCRNGEFHFENKFSSAKKQKPSINDRLCSANFQRCHGCLCCCWCSLHCRINANDPFFLCLLRREEYTHKNYK